VFGLLETFSQPDSSLTLSRLARDVYEVRHYGVTDDLQGVLEGSSCASAKEVGSVSALIYGSISDNTKQSSVTTETKRVCLGG
jgi:hypothetical protein